MDKKDIARSQTRTRTGGLVSSQQAAQVDSEKPVDTSTTENNSNNSPVGDPTYRGSATLPAAALVGVHTLRLGAYDQYANENGTAGTSKFVSPYPEGFEHLGASELYFRIQLNPNPTADPLDSRGLDDIPSTYDRLGLEDEE